MAAHAATEEEAARETVFRLTLKTEGEAGAEWAFVADVHGMPVNAVVRCTPCDVYQQLGYIVQRRRSNPKNPIPAGFMVRLPQGKVYYCRYCGNTREVHRVSVLALLGRVDAAYDRYG